MVFILVLILILWLPKGKWVAASMRAAHRGRVGVAGTRRGTRSHGYVNAHTHTHVIGTLRNRFAVFSYSYTLFFFFFFLPLLRRKRKLIHKTAGKKLYLFISYFFFFFSVTFEKKKKTFLKFFIYSFRKNKVPEKKIIHKTAGKKWC